MKTKWNRFALTFQSEENQWIGALELVRTGADKKHFIDDR